MPRHNNGPYLDTNEAGNYEIRWTEKGRSKRGSTGTKNLVEAQEALREFLGREAQQAEGEYPTDAIVDLYLAEHVNAEGSEVHDQERVNFGLAPIKEHFGSRDIGSITAEDCKEYARLRRSGQIGGRGRKVRNTTINYEILMLSVAANYARDHKKLPIDKMPILWRPQKAAAREDWVTLEQYPVIMSHVPFRTTTKPERFTRICLFLVIAFNTAARRQAIETLEWATQVDLERRLIDFNKPGRVQTAKRRPVVPMSDELFAVLSQAHEERDPKDPYVLPGGGSIRKTFDAAMDRAGFPWVTRHTIRRTWITWAFRRGVSKYDVADVTGDDPETLERHYRKHMPDFLKAAVAGSTPVLSGAQNGALRPDRGASPSTNDGQGSPSISAVAD